MKERNKIKAFSLIELSIVILIVGILVAGVTQSSRLIRQMSLMTARNLTQSSPVFSITGIVSWIETTSQSSFSVDPEDGMAVPLINDLDILSGPKLNFIQATAAKQPIYKNSNFNGLPSISFDGVDDEMVTSQILQVAEIAPMVKNTIFMVIRVYTSQVFFSYEKYDGLPRITLQMNGNNVRWDYPNAGNVAIGTTNIIGKTVIITADSNKINQAIYINGNLDVTRANSADINFAHSIAIAIGGNNGNMFTKCDIAEVIIYDRYLKTEERKSIEQYLGKKWKIPVS